MKKLIIFTGHLAALKSTLSKRIAKDLDIICLNKDDIKEVLGDTIGFTNRAENLKLTHATFELMIHLAKNLFQTQDVILIEANFKAHEIESIKTVFKEIHIETYFFTGNPKVLYERYLLRQPTRHPVHTSTGLIPYETFLKILTPVSDDLIINPYYVFDTTDMDENLYKSLKKEIENGLNV